MIFNRVTGLDIGAPPTYVIKENIKLADAPVRPPFLWNASIQDRTQWPGFAENGYNYGARPQSRRSLRRLRRLSHPKKNDARPLGFDYVSDNSANFPGLLRLEELIEKLGRRSGPGRWISNSRPPGKRSTIWKRRRGGCVECHGITASGWKMDHAGYADRTDFRTDLERVRVSRPHRRYDMGRSPALQFHFLSTRSKPRTKRPPKCWAYRARRRAPILFPGHSRASEATGQSGAIVVVVGRSTRAAEEKPRYSPHQERSSTN